MKHTSEPTERAGIVKQAPSFPKYAKDWLTGQATRLMTPEQRGAFDWLLCHSWLSDPPCSLPDDDVALAKLSELGRRWKTVGAAIRAEFEPYPGQPGLIRNPKLYGIYVEMIDLRSKRALAGSKGGSKSQASLEAKTNPPYGDGVGIGIDSSPEEGSGGKPFDSAAMARVTAKIDASNLSGHPAERTVGAWLSEYGEELILETLADAEPYYSGKGWQYLEGILRRRKDHPDQRPGNSKGRRPWATPTSPPPFKFVPLGKD